MHLPEGLTHIQSQIKPWLHFGESFTLNPVEMVWDELDRRVKAKQPTSAQHLWELLQDCWKTISGDYLMNLIIKRRSEVCKAVIKAKGGYLEENTI